MLYEIEKSNFSGISGSIRWEKDCSLSSIEKKDIFCLIMSCKGKKDKTRGDQQYWIWWNRTASTAKLSNFSGGGGAVPPLPLCQILADIYTSTAKSFLFSS